jgi:4-diphosphocytidyl-2C-methyl-D-erythritol kinase
VKVISGAVAVALVSFTALAAEPSVTVQADVVFASTAPGTVDPSLTKMRDQMAPKVKYLTMKKLETKTLELVQNKMQTVVLPNQKQAELTLQQLKENVATVKVKTPSVETVYTLAKNKTLSAPAGSSDGGDVWLVVSQPK